MIQLTNLSRALTRPMTLYKNTLALAEHPKYLFLSFWMNDPQEQYKYHDFGFVLSETPVYIHQDMPKIPVQVDPGTNRFLHNKKFSYVYEVYFHEASGQQRLRITGIRIMETNIDDDNNSIMEPWSEFITKFQDFHRRRETTNFDDDNDDDDDERAVVKQKC